MTDWTPAFEGQRPPFAPGNEYAATAAVTHGATSPARVSELAEQMEAEARGSEHWPQHLRSPVWAPIVSDYFKARAIAAMLWQWLDSQGDILAMITETGEERSEETTSKSGSRRMTSSRRVGAVMAHYDRAQGRVSSLSKKLGLDPEASVRLAVGMASTQYLINMGGQHPLDAAVDRQLAEDARRRELGSGASEAP